MRSAFSAATIAICVISAAACAPATSSTSFTSSEAMRAQPVAMGEVTSVRAVEIRPGQTRLGMATGAVLGGLAGSQIGGDTVSNVAGGVVGAVAGGALGSAIQGSRVTPGIEVTVALSGGRTVAIVQPGDVRDFRVGDRVRVIGDASNARVAR
jgi:outer membrane lipoprotein SlyB